MRTKDILNLKDSYPKVWEEFEGWLRKQMSSIEVEKKLSIFTFKGKIEVVLFFEALPFEMQSGVYLKYLDEKGLAPDGENLEFTWLTVDALKLEIQEALKIREKQLMNSFLKKIAKNN